MNKLIAECHGFLKNYEYPYAFCGGHALELFTGINSRSHSDIDITVFVEDRKRIIAYILSKGWNVYCNRRPQMAGDSRNEMSLNSRKVCSEIAGTDSGMIYLLKA